MEPEFQIILTTFPDQETAHSSVQALLENHLIACANLIPSVVSIYEWKGQVMTDQEILVILKTTRECYQSLAKLLQETHPYEVPEIIAVDISQGSGSYLDWVRQACQPPQS